MFVGVHALLAMRTNTPEIEIAPEEGAEFMKRAQAVMRHYSVETTQKTLDWIAFMGVSASIYAPRVMAIAVRQRGQRGSATVMEFRRPGPRPVEPAAEVITPDFSADDLNGV